MNSLSPYIKLVKENADYRRLWLAQSVSNFGDWFGLLALYALIAKYSDSEFMLGLIIIVKMLSLAVFSPFAGYITDRFNRRKLMIMCDVLRSVAVLGILLVQSESMLWLAYVLTSVQMMISAVFEPAKTASIPNVTSKEDLVNANIISTATWSIIFTSGMALGGFATELLGIRSVLIMDGLSYFVSAWFIYRAVIPQTKMSDDEKKRTRNPLVGIKEGFSYLFSHSDVWRPGIAKGTASLFIQGLVYMLIIVSEEELRMGSIGLGLLYAARGIGTGVGPVVARRVFKDESDWVKLMGISITLAGLMYLVVGYTHVIWVMLIFVFLAHCASGANWVTSTVLLQKRTDDIFRGRVFSSEWLLFTLTNTISVSIASLVLEFELIEVKPLMMIFAAAMIGGGLIWSFTVTRWERGFQLAMKNNSIKN